MERLETRVQFVCPLCKRHVDTTVSVPEPKIGRDIHTSEMTHEGSTDIRCSNCSTTFHSYVTNSSFGCDVTLDDYSEVEIDADFALFPSDESSSWINYEVPKDPHLIFFDSYHHTGDMLADHGGNGSHLMNRMIFAHLIGALEAYLGDTLMNAAMSSEETIHRLLSIDTEIGREKFSLAQIAADPAIVKTKVRQYLKSVIYHNLPKVRFLYQIVFNIDIFLLLGAEGKDALLTAVEYRHDCVHRNGHDKDGNRRDVFTKEFIQRTANQLKALVEQIEEANKPKPIDDEVPF